MAKTKGQQVSATISPELHTALEEHRWTVRMTMTELVRTAVEEYAANHDVTPSPTESEADSPSETESGDESA